MLDIKFVRENPNIVKENIKKKFQDHKLPMVDEVIELDRLYRAAITEASELRAQRNKHSKANGALFGKLKKAADEEKAAIQAQIDANMAAVKADDEHLAELERLEDEYDKKIRHLMMNIPNIIDPSVPIGPDDSANVEVERFGEPVVPDFEIPYHTEIMERFDGVDMDAAGRVSGNGFYYLMGDIARLHSAVLAYARDFMIGKGFTYCIPPFMIHGNVVEGVMSQTDMDAMMYKIEGEDLYLIGTSEHSMIGKFIDQLIPEQSLPQTLTSYSPCFRKEKGAHGIEERGVYRIHQLWSFSAAWRSRCASSSAAPATLPTSRSSPAISRPGARASRSTSRSAPAPTWATPRPAACICASRVRTGRPICPTPSTTPSLRPRAC